MNVQEQMREDWNRRAREDANYYVAFGRKNQSEDEFLATANEAAAIFESLLFRLPVTDKEDRRALEIGCGPGRLMIPMSKHFSEIHGVDVSDEMVALAIQKLARIVNAHVQTNSGSDLRMFDDRYFDFVYSWTVFQHIPDREVVLNYIREAQRVLKSGGILACQLRGVSPIAYELKPGAETWTGCWFSAEEIVTFALAHSFALVGISGIGTQYMMAVLQKRKENRTEVHPGLIVLKDVTAASSGERSVPSRGRESAVSLWIDGFPEDGDLAEFPVFIGEKLQTGCFVSPVSESGGCQLNVVLPQGLQLGTLPVQLSYRGTRIGEPRSIEIAPGPPRNPTVTLITDRINLLARNKIENEGAKVTIDDVECAEDVSFEVEGRRVGFVLVECIDPITSTYTFGFHLPQGVRKGAKQLKVRVGSRELEPIGIEIL